MPGPVFYSKQWNMFYNSMVTNKEGDDYLLGVESKGDDKVLINNGFDVIIKVSCWLFSTTWQVLNVSIMGLYSNIADEEPKSSVKLSEIKCI